MSDVAQNVEKVNQLLQAGEPGNITTDEHAGYTGYKPQAIVDAMNEGFSIGGWGFAEISSEIIPGDKGGLAIAQVQVWLAGIDFKPTSWGQNRVTRGDVGDAKKAAQTDAIKKALSYFSIGNRAYHGLLKESSNGHTPQSKPVVKPVAVKPTEAKADNDYIPINAPTPRELRERHKFLGMNDDFETVKYKLLKRVVEDGEMSPEMCIHINGFFDQVYAKAAKEAS
jgi:hypothetical protein